MYTYRFQEYVLLLKRFETKERRVLKYMTIHKKCGLAEIFQSGMLLQREKEIKIWGNAEPDTVVTISFYRETLPEDAPPSFCGEGKANRDGHFLVTLPPQNAGEYYSLCATFSPACTESVRLEHIGFGDIWLAGGQSNMEFFLKYDRDWETTKTLPRNPDICMYNVPQRAFEGHVTHNKAGYGYWFDDSDPGLAYFSAPAYSFARDIQTVTGIPVGIIGCNWGGSTASAWVPEEVLCTPPLDRYLEEYREAVSGTSPEKLTADSFSVWAFEDSAQHVADFEPLLYGRDRAWQLEYMKSHTEDPAIPMGPYHTNRPCGLFRTMLSEVIPFSLKGVLWYQGESDAGDHAHMYDKLLTGLIESWRKLWDDDLPFLIVQLAPFGVWLDCDNQGYAVVRDKQSFVADNVAGVYMASIMDLGSYYDIHPKEKMEVGRRLALLARGHIYDEKELLCDAPRAVCAVLADDRHIAVTFLHADGLNTGDKESDWNIRIGEADIKPSKVTAEEGRLILTLPEPISTDYPAVCVSLGFQDYAEIHIRNRAGLSAAPFQIKITQGELS